MITLKETCFRCGCGLQLFDVHRVPVHRPRTYSRFSCSLSASRSFVACSTVSREEIVNRESLELSAFVGPRAAFTPSLFAEAFR